MDALARLACNRAYWLVLLLAGVVAEAVALYYQYALDYYPCVLCIHVRIWILGMILVSVLGILLGALKPFCVPGQLLMAIIMAGLLDRSIRLLGTERGTIEGSCSMDPGLPSWFALDRWFPAMFRVHEPCGYTPQLPFGVTMAEALLWFSALMLLLSLLLLIAVVVSHSRESVA